MSTTTTITQTRSLETEQPPKASLTKSVVTQSGNAMLKAASKRVMMKTGSSSADLQKNNNGNINSLFARLDAMSLTDQRSTEKKTLIRFDRNGGGGLARLYRLAGGCVLTCWKRTNNGRYVRDGMEQWFDACGRIVRKRQFKNGRQVGAERIFAFESASVFAKAALIYSCTYNDAGEKNGVERKYEYVHGCGDGHFKVGATLRTWQYESGFLHGKERCESVRTSRILGEIEWVRGVRHGQCVTYFGNGNEAMRCTYVGGARNGRMVKYNRRGVALHTVNYCNGLKNGKEVICKSGSPIEIVWQCGVRIDADTGRPYQWR